MTRFFPSAYPRSRSPFWNSSTWRPGFLASPDPTTKPIRGIFAGCCALAGSPEAKMTFAIRRTRSLSLIDLLQKETGPYHAEASEYTSTSLPIEFGRQSRQCFGYFHSLSRAVRPILERRGALVRKIEQAKYQSCRMEHTPEDVVIMGVCKMGIDPRGLQKKL